MGDKVTAPVKNMGSAIKVIELSGADIDCTTVFGRMCVAVSFGGAGNLHVLEADGTDTTFNFSTYPSGFIVRGQFRKIFNSGTTATGVKVYFNRE